MSDSLVLDRKSSQEEKRGSQTAAEYRGRPRIRPTRIPKIKDVPQPLAEAAPSPRMLHGTVKWFNEAKGYGFIETVEGDIFVHVCRLKAYGCSKVRPGAKVHCEAILGENGLAAQRVLAIDESTVIEQLRPIDSTMVRADTIGGWERAWLLVFYHERGFGFFTRGFDMPDLFIHQSVLERTGFLDLPLKQEVEVRHGLTLRGRSDVVDIRLIVATGDKQ